MKKVTYFRVYAQLSAIADAILISEVDYSLLDMPTTVTVKATSPTNQSKEDKVQQEQDFEQEYRDWIEKQMLRYDDGAFYH